MIVSWTTSSRELKQKEDKIYNKVRSNQFSKDIFAFQSVIKSSTRNLFFPKIYETHTKLCATVQSLIV